MTFDLWVSDTWQVVKARRRSKGNSGKTVDEEREERKQRERRGKKHQRDDHTTTMTLSPGSVGVLSLLVCAALEGAVGGGGGGLPRVRWQPGTAVEEGDTVHLECQLALGVPGPAIWLKLDPRDPHSHVLLSHGEIVITDDPRFSVEHHPESNNYVVQIREVSAEDAGSYQCQVPVNSAEEDLRVEAAPPVVVTLLSSASSPAPTRPRKQPFTPARSSAAPLTAGNRPAPHAFLLFLCFLLLSNLAR